MEIRIRSLAELPEAARSFIDAIGDRRVFTFDAPMGAGKTTFIAEVCRQLGVEETVNSPSFSIINEYRDARGDTVYHFDFYRLRDAAEALEIGAEDYFYSGALCLIEWPERVAAIIPDEAVPVRIETSDDGSRTITLPS